MLSDNPSFGCQVMLDALQKYTNSPSPFSSFLNPRYYLKPWKGLAQNLCHPFSILQYVLQAFARLPKASWDYTQLGASTPPTELFLASPIEWWLQSPLPQKWGAPPISAEDRIWQPTNDFYGLWTGDILQVENKVLMYQLPLHTAGPLVSTIHLLTKRLIHTTTHWCPEVKHTISSPHLSLNKILWAIELPAGGVLSLVIKYHMWGNMTDENGKSELYFYVLSAAPFCK